VGINGNFSRINLGAVCYNGGGALALTRGNLARARPGLWRNHICRDGQTEALNLMGAPDGAYPRLAWRLPITAGRISGIGSSTISLQASGTGELGKPLSGSAAITFGASGTGGLIVSVAGTGSIAIDAAGVLFASKQAAGSAGISFAAAGALTAQGELAGSVAVSLDAAATLIGIGNIAGTTADAGLTATNVAAAVWQQVIEAGLSAEEILRIIAAHAAGAATGLEGGNPQFTGLDGSTLRIDGTYSAGTRNIDALDGS